MTHREHVRSTNWTGLPDGGGLSRPTCSTTTWTLYPLTRATGIAVDPMTPSSLVVPWYPLGASARQFGFVGGRTFPAIHAHAPTRPWRCIFDCHRPIEQVDDLARLQPEPQFTQDEVVWHRRMPNWLQTDSDAFDSLLEIHEPLSTQDLLSLLPRLDQSPDEDPGDAEITYPRRILAVDVGDIGQEPERDSADNTHIEPTDSK